MTGISIGYILYLSLGYIQKGKGMSREYRRKDLSQFLLRMPAQLKIKLKRVAKKEGRTMTSQAIVFLKEGLDRAA